MNKESLHFSFKSSIFAFKNPSILTIEDQKITAHFPKMKFGILRDWKDTFTIERENISSMKFSFASNIVFGILAIILEYIGLSLLDSMRYQEEYGLYATVSVLLGFFGGVYMYENIIKPKKKLEEMTLSIEFLIMGACVVISGITFLFAFFNTWFTAIFSGLFLAGGMLLMLSAVTLHFQIIDKKGFAYNFPFLFWHLGEINRIFRVNFPEFFQEKAKIITHQENAVTEEYIEQRTTPSRTKKKVHTNLLIWLIIGSIVAVAISYILPLESGSYPTTFMKMIKDSLDRNGGEVVVFAFVFPFILLVLLGIITFLKKITGGGKIFANILSGVTLSALFGIVFFPIHYLNIFLWKMSAKEIQRASDDITFGLWAIFLFIAMICMIVYTIKINSKK